MTEEGDHEGAPSIIKQAAFSEITAYPRRNVSVIS